MGGRADDEAPVALKGGITHTPERRKQGCIRPRQGRRGFTMLPGTALAGSRLLNFALAGQGFSGLVVPCLASSEEKSPIQLQKIVGKA
ncbi:MAG: hypothetical protein DMG05_02560 [Acidobacteria bacterium]|nr:MAG: hypothetical protein DMG05_02560 [Acidobacteriota bacterium]